MWIKLLGWGIRGIQEIGLLKHLKNRVKHLNRKKKHLINTKPTTDGEIYLIEFEKHAHKDSLSFFCVMVVLVILIILQ